MLAGSAEDDPRPCFPVPTAKENGHDECMWKSYFDTVDETIASTLKDREVVMVGGVGDYIVYK